MTEIPITQLRALLNKASDTDLIMFLAGYSLGAVTEYLIGAMLQEDQRAMFLTQIAKQYPSDWAKAIAELGK
jgi:hypothetical protein